MLNALTFDVDGSFCDTDEGHGHAFGRAFAETGLHRHWSAHVDHRLLRTTGGNGRRRAQGLAPAITRTTSPANVEGLVQAMRGLASMRSST